ncbi:hypothetical protein B0H11DRAFT_2224403 [Mycena galericulata]|nr:hypothetical protein B0H11DRAFT_2224403 [Mycena galericulata]
MANKRKKALPKIDKNIIPSKNIQTARSITINGINKPSVSEKIVGARAPVLPTTTETLSSSQSAEDGISSPEDTAGKVKKTQTAQLMDEFSEKFGLLTALLLRYKSDSRVGNPCPCGRGARSTQCRDCRQYDLSCETCWLEAHINNPFHWAHIWDKTLGFFVKHDICKVDAGQRLFTLGHFGKPCPNAGTALMFTIVETTGIHATRMHFCGCAGTDGNPRDKVVQLMEAGFFPGTVKEPRTAFSFEMLKRFHIAALESKDAACSYISSLRRLTDNAQTANVPDPYPAFLPTSRVYQYLKTLIRLGQAHGIDALMPERPAGNLVVACPACPEVGLNIKGEIPKIPPWLRHALYCVQSSIFSFISKRHIMQQQTTADGNFHTGHFIKNCDPHDKSLCDGKAQFPPDKEYRDYLRSLPLTKEKSTCTYLKAVNRQDKKKFKNMDVTGTINIQCSHVFVLATVDMHNGERFANTDAALARFLRRMDPTKDFTVKLSSVLDRAMTYDIVCEYFVHINKRFKNSPYLQDVAHLVERMRWGIPAMHVTGHKGDCMYLFGTAYMQCVGHFHGETAEQYWPDANKVGGHARQANNGHRQDMLVENANDWNWKKTVNMYVSLYDDLQSSKKLFEEKRKLFIGLSLTNLDNVEKWTAMPRETTKTGSKVNSVYRHTTSKVPSQTAIYQDMVRNLTELASTRVPMNEVACFLNEGLKIQENQRKLIAAGKRHAEHELQSTQKEVLSRRSKLAAQLGKWRKLQRRIMMDAEETIDIPQSCDTEREKLWLPSDFTESQRVAMGTNMIALASEEAKLRTGEAYDLIRCLQTICKGLSALEDRRRNVAGQKNNTTAGEQVLDARDRRDQFILSYNTVRKAMISLGTCQSDDPTSPFPHLTINDTFMKSRRRERALGDSRRGDGLLFTGVGIAAGSKISHAPDYTAEPQSDDEASEDEQDERPGKRPRVEAGGTQMAKRARRKPAEKRKNKEAAQAAIDADPKNKNGWLWELRRPSNMSEKEMLEWQEEGDRVQWARAEAEMDRFQEQKELKLSEFLRCIISFRTNAEIWTAMSLTATDPGFPEYAKQTAYMWTSLVEQCERHLVMAGCKFALEPNFDLVKHLEQERDAHDTFLRERGLVPRDKRQEAIRLEEIRRMKAM